MKQLASLFGLFSILAVAASPVLAVDQTIQLRNKVGIGTFLADGKGNTVYWFTKDAPGKSACAGPCVEKWPVFHGDKITPPPGVPGADFAVINREDGKPQSTFRGFPLYYWVNDKQPGDTLGHGVNNVWYVIDPSAFPPR